MQRAEPLEQVEGFLELSRIAPLLFRDMIVCDELPDLGTKVPVPLEESIRRRGVPDADRAVVARRGKPPAVGTPVEIAESIRLGRLPERIVPAPSRCPR